MRAGAALDAVEAEAGGLGEPDAAPVVAGDFRRHTSHAELIEGMRQRPAHELPEQRRVEALGRGCDFHIGAGAVGEEHATRRDPPAPHTAYRVIGRRHGAADFRRDERGDFVVGAVEHAVDDRPHQIMPPCS